MMNGLGLAEEPWSVFKDSFSLARKYFNCQGDVDVLRLKQVEPARCDSYATRGAESVGTVLGILSRPVRMINYLFEVSEEDLQFNPKRSL